MSWPPTSRAESEDPDRGRQLEHLSGTADIHAGELLDAAEPVADGVPVDEETLGGATCVQVALRVGDGGGDERPLAGEIILCEFPDPRRYEALAAIQRAGHHGRPLHDTELGNKHEVSGRRQPGGG
jgi:hypothetical protein